MSFNIFKNTVLLFVLIVISCANKPKNEKFSNNMPNNTVLNDKNVIIGANQTKSYTPFLKGKRVGIVANQTSVIFKNEKTQFTHLVDSLLSMNINIKKVFAPEHGFRGIADAGEHIKDGIDTKTNLPIISLYGENKKPNIEQLKDLDVVIFDIQDVGARFYTYISSLHYVMEACAENNIMVLILDRPNPNGHYIDGPILENEFKSFIGMHPIPVVHGMTIAEYAYMINGEKWLKNGVQCDLKVIPIKNYTHETSYSLPINPSPNLPNDKAINLYPSLCFFEGTTISVGRGTDNQFQVIGSPYLKLKRYNYEFKPQPNKGSKHPKHEAKTCSGYNLKNKENLKSLNLEWLIDFYHDYKNYSKEKKFFTSFFTKLAGTKKLQQQIESGLSQKEIKDSWQKDLIAYKNMRTKYLIYD